jgi:hypothetical protein
MSPCRFQFDFPGKAETLVETIRTHVARAGGSLTGTASSGSFLLSTPIGNFRGSYEVSGQTIVLEVADRPFFVPCSAIEAKLAEYIRDAR